MDDLPRQIDTRPPLQCGKCRHTDQIEVKGDEIHCYFCGNFAIVGMRARWPFRTLGEAKHQNIEISKDVNRGDNGDTPAVQDKKTKEAPMGTYGKTCAIPNCEKKSWLKGYCHKHYIEKFGEYVPENPFKNRAKKEPMPKVDRKLTKAVFPEQAAVGQDENEKDPAPLPGIRVIIPDKLLEKLAVVAEREYRTISQQAAYFVTKGLERE